MSLGASTPILRIFDEAKARAFYVDFLGFKVDWEHRFDADLPLYLQVSREGCTLHLTEHHSDCCPGAAVRIQTTELPAFQAELAAKSYRYARPSIEDMPWGARDMTIRDPFGNRLTFTEPQPRPPAAACRSLSRGVKERRKPRRTAGQYRVPPRSTPAWQRGGNM